MSGVDAWLGNLPSSWSKTKLKRATQEIGSGTTPSTEFYEYYDGGIPWIQSGDLYKVSEIKTTAKTVSTHAINDYSALKIYEAPFIVVAMYGASAGNSAISRISSAVNQACCVLTPNSRNSLRFIQYWLESSKDALMSETKGGGQPNLSQETIKNWVYAAPDLEQQRLIVAHLDSKTTQINSLIEKMSRQVRLLERYRRELIARTVTRGLDPDVPMKDSGIDWIGEVPLAWEVKRAKALFFQRKEKSAETDVHLTPSQIYGVLPQEEYIRISGTKPVLNLSAPNNMKHVETGDFIIHLRSFQGGIELSNYAGKVSNAYTVISARQSGDRNYYRWLLKSSPFIAKLSSLTDQLRDGQSINFKTFSHMVFPLPPLTEQRRIADFLDKKSSEIDSTVVGINKQIELLGRYRKQVINDLVTGKVRVEEAV